MPAGVVSLQAAFIGYKTTRVADLRVLAGQTITSDVMLESTPVVVEEITVVAGKNDAGPARRGDHQADTSGDYAEQLPVDRITNVLALQPGVVASTTGNTLSIRGGRTDEAATYIDGVPTGAGNRGGGFVGLRRRHRQRSAPTASKKPR